MQGNHCYLTSSKPGLRRRQSELFDVKMGRYDRAEGRELVGNFLLYAFSLKDNKTDIGLYKDDGLTVAY